MTKLYNVGMYCRLSVDDANNSSKAKNYIPADESVSIENQRALLSKFVMLNGWVETKTYIDDGYSGGNFQRPGFLEMLEDARKGIINLILVKDLSRLGRDFVEVGRYTDVVFPSLGCRFVSVLDCLDSEGDNTDMLHFRSLMNDYHLRDLSSKIKSVLHSKKVSGQFTSAYAPYGYRKSDEDKHRLVIDEPAAEIVRRIFDMRASGMAYGKITAALNDEDIPSPRWYWYQRTGKDPSKVTRIWRYATIKAILRNEAYIGTLVLNTTGTRSYKDHSSIVKPESEWLRHEESHEAIITPEVWDAVQKLNEEAKQIATGNQTPTHKLFSHKLRCADCGHTLQVNTQSQHRKNGQVVKYISYSCALHLTTGRSKCSPHRVSEITLKRIVIDEIKSQAQAVSLNETAIVDKLRRQKARYGEQHLSMVRQEITQLRRRVQELENVTAQLYEDKISGTITESTFMVLTQKNEQERLVKTERLDALLSETQQVEQDTADIRKWAAAIRKYLDLQELDRDTIDELIDYIEIGEHTVTDGQRRQDIKVHYRFVGTVE